MEQGQLEVSRPHGRAQARARTQGVGQTALSLPPECKSWTPVYSHDGTKLSDPAVRTGFNTPGGLDLGALETVYAQFINATSVSGYILPAPQPLYYQGGHWYYRVLYRLTSTSDPSQPAASYEGVNPGDFGLLPVTGVPGVTQAVSAPSGMYWAAWVEACRAPASPGPAPSPAPPPAPGGGPVLGRGGILPLPPGTQPYVPQWVDYAWAMVTRPFGDPPNPVAPPGQSGGTWLLAFEMSTGVKHWVWYPAQWGTPVLVKGYWVVSYHDLGLPGDKGPPASPPPGMDPSTGSWQQPWHHYYVWAPNTQTAPTVSAPTDNTTLYVLAAVVGVGLLGGIAYMLKG